MTTPVRQVFLPLVAVCLLIGCEGASISEPKTLYDGSGNDAKCPLCQEHFSCRIELNATEGGNITEQFMCVPDDGSSTKSQKEDVTSSPIPVNYGQCVPHINKVVEAQTAIDFIMVVDQKENMRLQLAWLKSFAITLHPELNTKNIGSSETCLNQYALIGFGGYDRRNFPIIYRTKSGSPMFSIMDFTDVPIHPNSEAGGSGYLALSKAMTDLPLRNSTRNCQIQRHILFMTKGNREQRGINRRDIESLLVKYHTYLHVIVRQHFVVNGSRAAVGISANGIGYKRPTNGDVCISTSPDFHIQKRYPETRRHYTSLALQQNVGGTAWNVLVIRLKTRGSQEVLECALVHEIQARSIGTCLNCSCNSVGQEECQPAEHYVCLRENNRQCIDGNCSLTNHSTCSPAMDGIPPVTEIQNVATEIILIVEERLSRYTRSPMEYFTAMIDDVNSRLLMKKVGQNSTCANHISLVGFGERSTRYSLRRREEALLRTQEIINSTGIQLRKLLFDSEISDVYRAIRFSMDSVLLQPSSTFGCKRSRHMILLTGEDRNFGDVDVELTRQDLMHLLLEEDTKLHIMTESYFTVPGVENILGRGASVGYSQSHAANSCVEIHSNVENDKVYEQTSRDFAKLAMALNGTVWDKDYLSSEPSRQSIACGLATLIASDLKHHREYCKKCTCDVNGNKQCTKESPSNPGQCYCEYADHTWNDGVCQRNQETSIVDLPIRQSSMTIAVAASAGAAVGCILLLVLGNILILRRRQSQSQDLHDLKSVHKAAPTHDLKSAAHHMMSMMVAPAGVRMKVIPEGALSFRRCIGKGQYGEVHLGHLSAKSSNTGSDLVAIKIMRSSEGSEEAQSQLLEEYFLQESVGEHPNIVKVILGGLFKAEPCIVMEYMAGGDLLQFLRNVKGASRLMNKGDSVPFLGDHEKLDISRQISLGLEFLASKQIVHRDIAARNMLVREHLTIPGKLEVKISDWGLSRKAVADGAYQAQTSRMLPLKWMAIESIDNGSFSEQSDVWSFGVLMWEVETGGEIPYVHTPNALLLHLVQNGHRLDMPAHCSPFTYSLMLRCWEADPSKRPSFSDLSKELTGMYELETNYVVLLGEDEVAASNNSHSQDDTAPKDGTPTKPVGSALMSVFQRMRQETVDEEYMPMGPQIGEDQSNLANPQGQLEPEKRTPRYVLSHPPLQLPIEDSETPSHTPPPCPQVSTTNQ